MAFTLPNLPYAANALEPSIDAKTMEIHHGRHHKAYVDNANKALEGQAALASKPVEQLLREISKVPDSIRQALINNAGGHANHSMFWDIMGPGGGGKPSGPLADDIAKTFGDFAGFQAQIKQAGVSRFGSGWAWLVLAGGKLQVLSTAYPRRRCLGTRLLPEIPEQAPGLHRRLVERGQLERGRQALQRSQGGQDVNSKSEDRFEYRIPKSETNSKFEIRNCDLVWDLIFEFVLFRISSF